MGKHLVAQIIDGKMYRDDESFVIEDEELHELTSKKLLPPLVHIYHYQSELQWERVLDLPVYKGYDHTLLSELHIYMSEYGRCRRCQYIPADGLWQGRFPIIHSRTGSLERTSPYKGYICEQCAQQLEWETGIRGKWVAAAVSKKGKKRRNHHHE